MALASLLKMLRLGLRDEPGLLELVTRSREVFVGGPFEFGVALELDEPLNSLLPVGSVYHSSITNALELELI